MAFSGTLQDGGKSYTESGMNSAGRDTVIGERHTAAEFEKPETLEFKSSLRWNHLLIGVADDRSVLGIAHDRLESDDKFMRHLAQAVRNGLGDRAGTCIDPRMQIVEGKTVCLVSCQRSPEPVFLRRKSLEKSERGDFYVRSGPGTVRLDEADVEEYVRTRFPHKSAASAASAIRLGS